MNRFVDWEIRTPMKIWIVVLSGWYANSHTLRIHWRSILLSRVLILHFSLSICQHCHGFFHLWYSIPISVDFVCRYLSSWGRFNKPCPAQRNGHVWRIFFIVIFCLTSTAIISFANNCSNVASTFSLVMIVVSVHISLLLSNILFDIAFTDCGPLRNNESRMSIRPSRCTGWNG